MAWQVVSAVLEHSNAPMALRAPLVAIGERADAETAEAWCSNDDIARRTGCTVRHVQRAKQKLVEMGELAVERGAGPHGVDRFTVLVYLNSRGEQESPHGVEGVNNSRRVGERESHEGDSHSSEGRPSVTQTREPSSNRPSTEKEEIYKEENPIELIRKRFPGLVELPSLIVAADREPGGKPIGAPPLRLTDAATKVLELAECHGDNFELVGAAARETLHIGDRGNS